MKQRSKIILAVLITVITVFEITAMLYILRHDKGSAAVTSSYVPSVVPANPASSGSVTFHPVSTGIRRIQPIMPATTVNRSTTSQFTPTVSTGWQIYCTSSQTVQHVGGGAATGVSATSSSHGASNRGIQTNAGSAPSLPVATIPLAARSIQDGMTAEQGLRAAMPRRVIIDDSGGSNDYGDDPLHPDYDPDDPFLTPVGDIPWIFLLLLCFTFCCKRILQRNRS